MLYVYMCVYCILIAYVPTKPHPGSTRTHLGSKQIKNNIGIRYRDVGTITGHWSPVSCLLSPRSPLRKKREWKKKNENENENGIRTTKKTLPFSYSYFFFLEKKQTDKQINKRITNIRTTIHATTHTYTYVHTKKDVINIFI